MKLSFVTSTAFTLAASRPNEYPDKYLGDRQLAKNFHKKTTDRYNDRSFSIKPKDLPSSQQISFGLNLC
jgi:hypothetical protein